MLSHAKQGSQRWAIMNSLSYRQYSFSDKPIANMIEYKDSSEIDRSNMESDLFFPIALCIIFPSSSLSSFLSTSLKKKQHYWSIVGFTVLRYFLLYSKVNQLYIHMYSLFFGFPSPGNLPNPGIKPMSPVLVLAGEFFTTEPPGKPKYELSVNSVQSPVVSNF